MPRGRGSSKASGAGCERGRGRGPGRGRGSRGRGRGIVPQVDLTLAPSDEPSSGRERESEKRGGARSVLETIRRNALLNKRTLSNMPAAVKAEFLQRKREEQLERILLPDAPPRKRARNDSPERSVCRLVAGTPSLTPPPPKPQPWEIRRDFKQQERTSHLQLQQQQSIFSDDASPADPAMSSAPSLVCDWTTGQQIHHGSVSNEPPALLEPPATVLPSAKAEQEQPSTSVIANPVMFEYVEVLDENMAEELRQAEHIAAPTTSMRTCDDSLTVSQDDASAQMEAVENPKLLEWLEQQDCHSEDEEVGVHLEETTETGFEHNIDFACEAPAHLPDELEIIDKLQTYMTREDEEADRLMRGLLTTEYLTFDWTSDSSTFKGQREEFVGPYGPTFPLENTTRPIEVFLKYFDDELLDLLVRETNRNARNLTKPDQRKNRFYNIKCTDRSEMGVFLAILVLQGLVAVPVEKDYFKENGYLTLKYFKDLMTYSRFILLKRLLEFADNDAPTDDLTENDKKLRKLGPLLKLLNSRFSSLYLPSQDIAIDESLLKWHDRLSFAQKISTKAAKVGVKSYELCESNSGYCWNFLIYTGKGHANDQQTEDETESDDGFVGDAVVPNVTAQIVLDLVRPLLNKGHCLVMDNFYNSPLLARYLKMQRTDCFGTLRVNREFVPEGIKSITKSTLRPGEMVQSYCRDLSVTMWRDSNLVALISTIHGGEVGGKQKYGKYKYRPQVVMDYNMTMGGVDKKDQLLSAHPIERQRNQEWYKKVFRRLLNVTILNAYIVYKTCKPRCNQRDFRMTLAEQLIATFKVPTVPPPIDNRVTAITVFMDNGQRRPILSGNHFISQGHSRYAKCVWCKKSRTKYICKQCGVSLCLVICFEGYHTTPL